MKLPQILMVRIREAKPGFLAFIQLLCRLIHLGTTLKHDADLVLSSERHSMLKSMIVTKSDEKEKTFTNAFYNTLTIHATLAYS